MIYQVNSVPWKQTYVKLSHICKPIYSKQLTLFGHWRYFMCTSFTLKVRLFSCFNTSTPCMKIGCYPAPAHTVFCFTSKALNLKKKQNKPTKYVQICILPFLTPDIVIFYINFDQCSICYLLKTDWCFSIQNQ